MRLQNLENSILMQIGLVLVHECMQVLFKELDGIIANINILCHLSSFVLSSNGIDFTNLEFNYPCTKQNSLWLQIFSSFIDFGQYLNKVALQVVRETFAEELQSDFFEWFITLCIITWCFIILSMLK